MMMRVSLVLTLLLAVALGGCLADHKPGNDAPADDRAAFDQPHDLLGCTEMSTAILVDKARAEARLPDNVSAREAGDALGIPVPEGSAALIIAAWRCEGVEGYSGGLEWATVGLVIEPIKVGNESLSAASDLFVLDHYADRAEERLALARIGIWAENGSLRQTPLIPDRFVGGDSTILGDDGKMRYRFGVATPRSERDEGVLRLWNKTADGVGWFEATWSTSTQIGTVTHCTLGAKTVAASLIRDTDCSEEAVLASYRSIDLEAGLHWRPSEAPAS